MLEFSVYLFKSIVSWQRWVRRRYFATVWILWGIFNLQAIWLPVVLPSFLMVRIFSTISGGVSLEKACGQDERSSRPDSPSSLKRFTHFLTVCVYVELCCYVVLLHLLNPYTIHHCSSTWRSDDWILMCFWHRKWSFIRSEYLLYGSNLYHHMSNYTPSASHKFCSQTLSHLFIHPLFYGIFHRVLLATLPSQTGEYRLVSGFKSRGSVADDILYTP